MQTDNIRKNVYNPLKDKESLKKHNMSVQKGKKSHHDNLFHINLYCVYHDINQITTTRLRHITPRQQVTLLLCCFSNHSEGEFIYIKTCWIHIYGHD